MKKYFMYALSMAVCVSMVSCGDDDDNEQGGGTPVHGEAVESPAISDLGGYHLIDLNGSDSYGNVYGGSHFNYNNAGALSEVFDGDDKMSIDYRNGTVTFTEDGESQNCALYTNSKGYVTRIIFSGYESPSEPFTVTHNFVYNSDDRLISYSCIDTGKDEGSDYREEQVCELTWEGDLLVRSTVRESRNGVTEWENATTFGYTDAPVNTHMQYTVSLMHNLDIDGDISAPILAGAFGKGPAKYPTSIIKEYETVANTYSINTAGLVDEESNTSTYSGDAGSFTQTWKYTYSKL